VEISKNQQLKPNAGWV